MESKSFWTDVLNIGDQVDVEVIFKDRKVCFESALINWDEKGEPALRFIDYRSCAGLHLTDGEVWTGTVRRINRTNKMIPLMGHNRRVVYYTLTNLRRCEKEEVWYTASTSTIYREVKCGTCRSVEEVKVKKEGWSRGLYNGMILIADKLYAGSTKVMEAVGQLQDIGEFCEEQRKLSRGPFDAEHFVRNLRKISAEEFNSFGKLLIPWNKIPSSRR